MNRIFRGFALIVRHRSLTLHFEPFRFWLRILGDILIRKRTPRLNDTVVGDSLYQRYAESATLRLNDMGSRRLSASLIRGVDDSPHHRYRELVLNFFKEDSLYQWYGESSTPHIVDTERRRLPVSLSREVANCAYCWYRESPTPHIVESGSRRLRVSGDTGSR